jgi:nucleotide-binding universal stress UspA family protein
VRRAGQDGVDLVLTGMRRRSPVGTLLRGSTVRRNLLDVSCPGLAVAAAG